MIEKIVRRVGEYLPEEEALARFVDEDAISPRPRDLAALGGGDHEHLQPGATSRPAPPWWPRSSPTRWRLRWPTPRSPRSWSSRRPRRSGAASRGASAMTTAPCTTPPSGGTESSRRPSLRAAA